MTKENSKILHRTFDHYGAVKADKSHQASDAVPTLKYGSEPLSHKRDSSDSSNSPYKVPAELIQAARVVAEAQPLPLDGNSKFMEQSESLRAERHQRDTFAMAPVLQKGDGLHASSAEPGTAYRFSSNESESTHAEDSDGSLEKRSASHWWMAKIKQRGSSPFAPKGYKVWRNVKDYGAKGDGKADDTEAINRAISDGRRCGQNCFGSTVYPATVYFPPGVYLVSSSIIQYYNTEIVGDPLNEPRIIAASSFVGLGVIMTTTVYNGENTQWHSNTRNFLRSVRNLYIDIRHTPKKAQVCSIFWQAAQGTSIENVVFWADTAKDTTQQGIYVENGSGGFLANLLFIGGKYGAFMGNQQFTASELWFNDILDSAIQLRWDWGWTFQGVNFKNVKNGFKIIGGEQKTANRQGVGSVVVTDVQGEAMDTLVSSNLGTDNSTSILIQNALLKDVDTYVINEKSGEVLLPGDGNTEKILPIESWGFGKVTDTGGNTTFVRGGNVAAPKRNSTLTRPGPSKSLRNIEYFFTRRRPSYANLAGCELVDVKTWGAKGDGKSDDTAALSRAFAAAANMSAVVYVPYGVYIIKDTVTIPVGSRVIGQAWPQLMGTGAKFEDINKPRPVVRVGVPGNEGVADIQSLMFTVRGPTAGAVLLEWNVHESFQGSAGLWDSHFRVGGAKGGNLQAKDCPSLPDTLNPGCVAASLMLHVTPKASAYLENVWVWAADHDIDDSKQTNIDIYAARGILIESSGPTWLWGTSVEHCLLYQYQLSGAENVMMGLVRTESPYFQPYPPSPGPFYSQLGAFSNDPAFQDCDQDDASCGFSWGVRMVDSKTIYMLSTGLYSWFQKHDRQCIDGGRMNCQEKTLYTEQTSDVWVYNLVTVGVTEMISPFSGKPVDAAPNRNGLASSLLAWRGGINGTTGLREFDGYTPHSPDAVAIARNLTQACRTALTAKVKCHDYTQKFTTPQYHSILDRADVKIAWVCADECKQSVDQWVDSVERVCKGQTWANGAPAAYMGGYVQYGLKEQCQKDDGTSKWCNDIIAEFGNFSSFDEERQEEICSDCYVGRLKMMQASPYSIYRTYTFYHDAFKSAKQRCNLKDQETEPQPPLIPIQPEPETWCLSENIYDTKDGDTCDLLAEKFSVSSASIYIGNSHVQNCSSIDPGTSICLSLQCRTYTRVYNQDCMDVSVATGIRIPTIKQLNPWISNNCDNIKTASWTYGNVLCISPIGGEFKDTTNTTRRSPGNPQYATKKGDNCASIMQNLITSSLFRRINPSVSGGDCTAKLVPEMAYCNGPIPSWSSWEK
ncbi:pectate lyase superfamily protein-domain-containing protein [Dactylonectria estremocensis]|uniref:Pectate lyase superfamily protein-domain-containing protein n=1 Tax=Dactylonectria estremocensis TaxID=1079267 RepID=A0A9P9EXF9_9HYPO|nr:pectate lyase superfamily protein-domain-containing protein [Dactylonectria estremocensis]